MWALVLLEAMGKTEELGLQQGATGVPWIGPCPAGARGGDRVGLMPRNSRGRIARATAAAVARKGHPCLRILIRIAAVTAALESGRASLPGLGSTSNLPHSMG